MAPYRRFPLALVVALLVAAPVAVAQQAEADVTGDWSLAMEGPQGMVNMEVAFHQDHGELTGTLNGPMGSTELGGEIEGTEISFWISVETPNGAFDLVFNGKVEENKKISGVMQAEGGEFPSNFTAVRKEAGN